MIQAPDVDDPSPVCLRLKVSQKNRLGGDHRADSGHTEEITLPSLPRSSSQHLQKYLRKLAGKMTSGLLWLLGCNTEADLAKLLKMDGLLE